MPSRRRRRRRPGCCRRRARVHALLVGRAAGHPRLRAQLHAVRGVVLAQLLGELARVGRAADELLREHEGDAGVVLHQRRGELGADVAAAHDGDVPALAREPAQPPVVVHGAEVHDPVVGGQVQLLRVAAGGQQQPLVAEDVAVLGGGGAGGAVDRPDAGGGVQGRAGLVGAQPGLLEGELRSVQSFLDSEGRATAGRPPRRRSRCCRRGRARGCRGPRCRPPCRRR